MANYLKGHFLGEPLRDWDISRPAPYFGFEIPDSPGNYWYVWFDAPIGYIGSTQQWCERHGERNSTTGGAATQTEIHHFIGKDITYFHTLFWPGMLKTAGFSLPTKVHIHGFLTVDGEKMSKSKGTFVRARHYLKHLDPAYLRYYYASKLGPRVDDLDLNLDEFVAKVNADLVGKVVNLASRTAKFVQDRSVGGVSRRRRPVRPRRARRRRDRRGLRELRLQPGHAADHGAGRRANQFVEAAAPWNLRKDPEQAEIVAGRLHGGAEPVPPTGDLPRPGAAAAGRADRRAAQHAHPSLGRIQDAADGHDRWRHSNTC